METTATTKVCPKCKRELPLSEYHKNARVQSGVQTYCKKCQNEYNRISYAHKKVLSSHGTNPQSPFASMMPREIIGEIKERINYLRSTGWVFEGKLEYTQVITIEL